MPHIEVKDQSLATRLSINPQSDEHRTLVGRLRSRLDLSRRNMSNRYDSWDTVDENIKGFIDLSRRARLADGSIDPNMLEMPFQRAIVVPMSLAILQTRMTGLMSIFGNRVPMIQIDGRGPEDVKPAKLFEAVIDYDGQQTQAYLAIYGLLQDSEKYGIGIMHDTWEQEPGWVFKPSMLMNNPVARNFLRSIGFPLLRDKEWGTLSEFNRWQPVDPFFFWPDPRVPNSDVKNMEFIGHRNFRSFTWLLERKIENGGPFFNIDQLPRAVQEGRKSEQRSRDRFIRKQFGLTEKADEKDRGFYALDHIQIKLIPKEWKLSTESRPEIWWFTLADEFVLIRAHRSRHEHGQFTYSVGEPNYDPHTLSNPGTMENLDGLQRLMNWLFASHLENVRKILNDAMIYGPTFIEEADLLNPGPARHIRLTQKAEELMLSGRLSLPQILFQLPITDVTRGHLADMEIILDMAERLAATNEIAMGQTARKKKTLGEIQRVVASQSARISTVARLMDSQVIRPVIQRSIANRQQFTSIQQYFRIAGEAAKESDIEQVMVSRDDLQGNFNYIANSGVLPADPSRLVEVWTNILKALGQNERLLEAGPDGKRIDVRAVFLEAVQAAGIKNFKQFIVSVMPDQQVQAQAQAGNLVQMGQEEITPDGTVPGAGIQTGITPVGVDLGGGDGAA